MIFRFIHKEYTIASNHEMEDDFKQGRGFKFNIKVEDLASNYELLNALKLESIFSKKDNGFFRSYLDSFQNKKPRLENNTLLQILVTNEGLQEKITNILT